MRVFGVLQFIGFARTVAALLVLGFERRARLFLAIALLLGPSALFGLVGAPDFPDAVPEGVESLGDFDEAAGLTARDVRQRLFGSDELPPTAGDGAVRLDGVRGGFTVATARTAGGFAESGTVEADSVRAVLAGAPATVWASALDTRPIRTSARILVTHLTDVQNTGAQYADEDLKIITGFGGLPYLMRRSAAGHVPLRNCGRFRSERRKGERMRRERPIAPTLPRAMRRSVRFWYNTPQLKGKRENK